ncbi:hypothetical protein EV363DRAFT_1294394 [Boletus edulis]|nr:hypothetical protein EV363DRAFT_1294394 [Boletus edulis]
MAGPIIFLAKVQRISSTFSLLSSHGAVAQLTLSVVWVEAETGCFLEAAEAAAGDGVILLFGSCVEVEAETGCFLEVDLESTFIGQMMMMAQPPHCWRMSKHWTAGEERANQMVFKVSTANQQNWMMIWLMDCILGRIDYTIEHRDLWHNRHAILVPCTQIINPDDSHYHDLVKGLEELSRGVHQQNLPHLHRAETRMEMGIFYFHEGVPHYFVNEVERTLTTSLFLSSLYTIADVASLVTFMFGNRQRVTKDGNMPKTTHFVCPTPCASQISHIDINLDIDSNPDSIVSHQVILNKGKKCRINERFHGLDGSSEQGIQTGLVFYFEEDAG